MHVKSEKPQKILKNGIIFDDVIKKPNLCQIAFLGLVYTPAKFQDHICWWHLQLENKIFYFKGQWWEVKNMPMSFV